MLNDEDENNYDADKYVICWTTWAPRDGRERAILVVDSIQGVGLENPSDAQNNGTNLVLNRDIYFWGIVLSSPYYD